MRRCFEVPCPLSIMVKPPVPGLVKTRLARGLGDELAARLAAAFLADTLATVDRLPWAQVVLSTTEPRAAFFRELLPRRRIVDQGPGDLGARLSRTLELGLGRAPLSMVIAADSPGLPCSYLEHARGDLETHDAVLGPALDGGFYLLGLRRLEPGLLDELPWSSERTFEATYQRLEARGYEVAVLEPWLDVDDSEALARLMTELVRGRIHCPHTEKALGMRVTQGLGLQFTQAPARL
ncbi:MAG: TIGR04282 family arsenosugar biosynthesis glycosyltransferase [Myxococcota bacterium]|jgi:hypothetical protein|nr:TIGR04282 family arsenosugar biosynthesis glycosyltransferase [Myxococcota bacterium]